MRTPNPSNANNVRNVNTSGELNNNNANNSNGCFRGGLSASIRLIIDYYDKAIEFGTLYKALKKCCKNVRWKDSVVGYEANALKNTYLLRQDLLNGTYKISPYQVFQIHEPKERTIVATRIRDRQFQRELCDAGY